MKVFRHCVAAIAFLLVTITSFAQFEPEVVSITNIRGKTWFQFGDSLNIRVKYKVPDTATNEQALKFIKSYFLVINSVPHHEMKLSAMRAFLNTRGKRDSVAIPTAIPDAPFKSKFGITEGSTIGSFVVPE